MNYGQFNSAHLTPFLQEKNLVHLCGPLAKCSLFPKEGKLEIVCLK